ncbi:MAG: DUF1501 domain-containing protein [Planctomycetaceae bacterium]
MSPWLKAFAESAVESAPAGRPKRHCILLWMSGGPTQTDTFDMKPGHANGGEFKEIETKSPGLRFSEHLPKLAQQADQLAVIRGLTTAEGDHGRGTYLMRTGRRPDTEIRFPTMGSVISKELASEDNPLPDYVSVNPYLDFSPTAFESGFLGPRFAPLAVRPRLTRLNVPTPFAELGVDHLRPPEGASTARISTRLGLLETLQSGMIGENPGGPTLTQNAALQRAVRLMSSDVGTVFDLSGESVELRTKYGPGSFGQGCLLARRLIERGVSFVEVTLGGPAAWDTHGGNFPTVQRLSQELDLGWSALMEDLAARNLLESTTIVWMGEFGRTPQINGNAGRDHFPAAWTAVLAGGGIRGGQAYGRTGADGMLVEENPVGVGDVLATLCRALGIDHKRQNISDIGRPFRIAEGTPIDAVLMASNKTV